LYSGKAAFPEFKSKPEGYEPNNYLIEWSSMSYSPITEFELLFRRHSEPKEVWKRELIVPHKTGPISYAGKLSLGGLDEAAQYEAKVRAKNEEGWNRLSQSFQFATFGAGEFNQIDLQQTPQT
jgi:hypothetical protein